MGWGNRWKVSILCEFTGKSIFMGGSSQKKTVCKGNFLKRGLGQFTDLRGSLRELSLLP